MTDAAAMLAAADALGMPPEERLRNIAGHERYYLSVIRENFPSCYHPGFGWTGRNCGAENGAYRRKRIWEALRAVRICRELRGIVERRRA